MKNFINDNFLSNVKLINFGKITLCKNKTNFSIRYKRNDINSILNINNSFYFLHLKYLITITLDR